MDKFNKRLADVFGALDSLQTHKSEQNSPDSLGSGEDSRNVPPAKRAHKSGTSSSNAKTESRQKTTCRLHGGSRFKGHQHSYHKRVTPEYVTNPDKWTKYDLKDDGTKGLKGMSADEVNRHAALEFLHELKERKPTSTLDDSSEDVSTAKITFKKPSTKKMKPHEQQDRLKESTSYDLGSGSGSGVLRMAEYVVGRDEASKRRSRQVKQTLLSDEEKQTTRTRTSKPTATVALSHLIDEDC